ncbi:MAG: hypothetical protein KIS94_05190 [Chitinophagales bacterium]|nr:hypothetical protein [Chitinophagales bacterium]
MKLLIITLLSINSIALFAQKVQMKNGVITVNKQPFLQYDCKHIHIQPCVFSSPVSGIKHFSTMPYPYTEKVRVHKGGNTWVEEPRTAYYFHVKWIDGNQSFYTRQQMNWFIKALFNAKVIDDSGTVDSQKLDEFIKIHGEDKPIIININ